jgi:hypothetical protein
VPRKSIQLYGFALSNTSKSVPKSLLYGQHNCPLHQQKTLKLLPRNPCSKLPRFLRPPSLLYGLYGFVQCGLSNNRKLSTHKKKILLGFVPKNSWETCPLCCPIFSLKLTQKFSLNLLLSMCLTHYPMHSFINLKMTFSLQSVFSPSPNPKSKVQDLILPLQDQGP